LCIVINSDSNAVSPEITLAHEIGHAKCDEKKCKCFKNKGNSVLREYHAYQYELKTLLKHGDRELLSEAIRQIELTFNFGASYGYEDHATAIEKIMKLKLWQKCLEAIK
jgi:hypothetical protein